MKAVEGLKCGSREDGMSFPKLLFNLQDAQLPHWAFLCGGLPPRNLHRLGSRLGHGPRWFEQLHGLHSWGGSIGNGRLSVDGHLVSENDGGRRYNG